MTVHLKEDLNVELTLMHKYGIITVRPFSKYPSPTFAQRRPNGKLCLLVDLMKRNFLIADDYTNITHPVGSLSDAAQHLAEKTLLCKLDSSQVYHCLQMADQQSVEMLAFNFASANFVCKKLAEGLSKPLSVFLTSCASTCTHKPTNVLNVWTILELQPTRLRTLSGSFGGLPVHSSSRMLTDSTKVPFWSQTGWIPGQHAFTRRNFIPS